MVFCNFRSDRMREITTAFSSTPVAFPSTPKTATKPSNLYTVTMTRYDSKVPFPVIFPPCDMVDGLAEWISKQGLRQFHTAETEKYAHVTFFFNGGVEQAYANEDRRLIPSPKVATYDLDPGMSADGVADSVCQALREQVYQFVMCNLAPPDMVGHTGILPAAIEAIKYTDAAIRKIA
uniref:phosphoglycerate mutase (2,3-diphosphoglycerate-independent) n=1 Tax=Lygus hesperus TaxID=30085 RepID=A0A0A9Y7V7_LYGHE